jgi:murein DD-endopeptidase MepM/ murein hydrolase activator NlpD
MEAAERSGIGLSFVIAGFFLAACAGPATQLVVSADPPIAAPPIISEALPPAPATPPPVIAEAPVQSPAPTITCASPATQGGAVVCRTIPAATVSLNGKPVAVASMDGIAVVGLTRDAPAQIRIGAKPLSSEYEVMATVDVLPRTDAVSKLTMECGQISAQTPAQKRHAEVSWVKKDEVLKTFAPPLAPISFIKPADGPYSSPYGATRTYTPKTNDCEATVNVHNGQDIAIPTGTQIRAPMAGTVILADPDLYYEGGCIFLDLGYGLVSVTMHMSRIDVKAGDRVEQGQLLGLSGATGRVTGPHLHWAIKYRNVNSSDRGTDIWLDPVLLLGLKSPD